MHNWGGQIDDSKIYESKEIFSSTCFFPFSQCFIQIDGNVRICCLDVNGKNIFMEDVKLPFASYNKKFEYENAKMFLTNINVKDFHEKWIIDDNSKIFLGNSPVGKVSKNIIQVIYQKNLELLNKSIN